MARTLLAFTLVWHSLLAAQPQPLFHWKLDETSGGTAFAGTGPPHGTLVGGTQWDPAGGHHQGAARFDGVNDRIVLGPCDLTSGGNAISLSLWMKPDFVTGMERTLIAKTIGPSVDDHVWSIALVNATAPRFRLKAAGTTSELALPPSSLFGGTWYHMAAVYDGTEMRLYVNASLMGSMPKSGTIGYHPQAPASLGATSSGTEPFSGWIDDVRIFDLALSGSDIISILFEDISTGFEHMESCAPASIQRLALGCDRVHIADHMGRIIMDAPGNAAVELPPLSSGLYIVALQRGMVRTTLRMAVP